MHIHDKNCWPFVSVAYFSLEFLQRQQLFKEKLGHFIKISTPKQCDRILTYYFIKGSNKNKIRRRFIAIKLKRTESQPNAGPGTTCKTENRVCEMAQAELG